MKVRDDESHIGGDECASRMMKPLWCMLLYLVFPCLVHAQVEIRGTVFDSKRQVLPFAAVYVADNDEIGASCTMDGTFRLKVPSLPVTLHVSMIGFRQKDVKVTSAVRDIEVVLQDESLSLPGVVVSAQRNSSANGTSAYTIGEQAIRQIQAMSLGDVLTLLPGARLTTPSMTNVQQFAVRSTSSSSSNGAMANAFGASVIIDGMRLSNDGNMQAYDPASGLYGGKSVVGGGIDLRDISPVGIDRVEVVTGVPSAKYGNIASGTVIVKSKTTPYDMNATLSLNSTNYQLGLTHGVRLGRSDVLNYDLTGTYANESAVQKKYYYQSLGLGMRWQREVSQELGWNNTVSFSGLYSFNGQRSEKEDNFNNRQTLRNWNLSLSTSGSLNVLQRLDYSFSMSMQHQYSFVKEHNTDGPLPLIEGLETGTYQSGYSSMSYDLEKTVTGQPVNVQGNISTTQNAHWGMVDFMFDTGVQFQYDKNIGKGLVGTGAAVGATGALGSRSIQFNEIPSSIIWSAYHEIRTNMKFTDIQQVVLSTGVRYDYMDRRYNLFSPRLSTTFKALSWLSLRAAWGLSYKAPAMIQLYPGPSYIDYMNLGFYPDNEKERMAVVTTYKYIPDNSSLKPMRGMTWELGFDLNFETVGQFQATYYRKVLDNSIVSSPELLVLPLQHYEVVKRYDDRWPDIRPIEGNVDMISQIVRKMKNTGRTENAGLEVVFSTNEIKTTHTKLDFRFSFMQTSDYNRGYNMVNSQYVIGNKVSRIGVYGNPVTKSYDGMGNVTVIQQLPRLGLIFTLTGELNFYNYSKLIAPSLYPSAYYTLDGSYHPLTLEESMSDDYKDLKLSEWTFNDSARPPFYPNFHLTVRKELKGGHTLNFYAHNFLWYNPTYTFNKVRRKLNDNVSFGFGMTFKL